MDAEYGSFKVERLQLLRHWITKREEARVNKDVKQTLKPWSDDPILQSTRFCNVRRMDDKVSIWLVDEWYEPSVNKGTLLAAAGLARLINWPDALDALRTRFKFREWNPVATRTHFEQLKANKLKVFTGAYIINGGSGGNKVDTVLRQINTLYRHPELVHSNSMQLTHAGLQRIPGIGSFMAGQIVADLRHVWPGTWGDRDTWAPIGPGSHRGMGWLTGWNGIDKLARMSQLEFERKLGALQDWCFQRGGAPLEALLRGLRVEAHDMQNCLCEFDKYMRLLNGTGRAKNKFDGV